MKISKVQIMKAIYIQPQTIIDVCAPENMLAESMFTRPDTSEVGISFDDEGISPENSLAKENTSGFDW